jgi:hypothetical protein
MQQYERQEERLEQGDGDARADEILHRVAKRSAASFGSTSGNCSSAKRSIGKLAASARTRLMNNAGPRTDPVSICIANITRNA